MIGNCAFWEINYIFSSLWMSYNPENPVSSFLNASDFRPDLSDGGCSKTVPFGVHPKSIQLFPEVLQSNAATLFFLLWLIFIFRILSSSYDGKERQDPGMEVSVYDEELREENHLGLLLPSDHPPTFPFSLHFLYPLAVESGHPSDTSASWPIFHACNTTAL